MDGHLIAAVIPDPHQPGSREDGLVRFPFLRNTAGNGRHRIIFGNLAEVILAQIIALLERYYTPAGIGVDNGGMTRLAVRDGNEIKKRTKELMTSLINGALQRKQLIFPSDDLEVEDQFTTHTYTLRDGKIIYSKGNDNIIDAVRCAMLIREEGNLGPVGEEVVSLKPVLANPVFI